MKEHVVMVLRKEDRFLFVRRALTKTTLPGMWSFPSGTMEENEGAAKTLVREAMEELGVDVNPIKLFAEKSLEEFGVNLLFYLCESNEEPTIKQREEIDELSWMTFSEFFDKFTDEEIGHGLVWLRGNQNILREIEK